MHAAMATTKKAAGKAKAAKGRKLSKLSLAGEEGSRLARRDHRAKHAPDPSASVGPMASADSWLW